MDILKALLDAGGGRNIAEAGQRFGIDQNSTQQVVAKLLPALAAGLKKNVSQSGGLESLVSALGRGSHQRYLDDAAAVTGPESVTEGNAILGHLFGSKDVSRQVASRASESTGVDVGAIKKLLPVIASMAMGALSKQTNRGAQLDSSGAAGMLGGLLDRDGDGQVFDDLLNLGKKFL